MRAMTLALVFAGVAGSAGASPSLYITTDHSQGPDPQSADGPDYVALVHRLAQHAGIAATVEHFPWKRAYAIAAERADACVFLTTRTPEREALFKWVGPLVESKWILAGRAGHDYGIRTLEDARKYRIGTFLGDARHDYLAARGFNLDAAPQDSINPQKLKMGRIDLWAAAVTTDGRCESPGHFPSDITPVLRFKTAGLYLACNRAVPDAWIARLNRAVTALCDSERARR